MIVRKLLLVMLMVAMCSSGCSNFYQDINRTILITAILVDVGEDGGPKIYFEGFRPERTAAKDKKEAREIFIISGKTVAEIISSLNTMVSNKPNFSHNKIIFFSKKATEVGLARYTDFFARNQENLVRCNVAVYDGRPEDLFTAKLPGDQFLGLYCFDLFRNYNNKSAKLLEVKIQNLFNGRYEFGAISVLPMVTVTQHIDKLITVSGAVVLRDFKLVAVLSPDEVSYYSAFQNTLPNGVYTMENPQAPGHYLSLRSVGHKIKTRIEYDGNQIVLVKKIELDMSLREAQELISLTPEQLEQLRMQLTKQLQGTFGGLFEKYKAQSVDIFSVEEMFRRKYPHEDLENPLANTVLNLDIEINMEGSGHYRGFN